MSEQPWTWNQFHRQMKAAGWKRVSKGDPGKAYCHSCTDRKWYPLTWHEGRGENWLRWAEARATPPPF